MAPPSTVRVYPTYFLSVCKAFSKLESEVPNVVAGASAIMALVVFAIACVTGCTARSVSNKVTRPVEQLAAVVHALNNMDFSRQVCAHWLILICCLILN